MLPVVTNALQSGMGIYRQIQVTGEHDWVCLKRCRSVTLLMGVVNHLKYMRHSAKQSDPEVLREQG